MGEGNEEVGEGGRGAGGGTGLEEGRGSREKSRDRASCNRFINQPTFLKLISFHNVKCTVKKPFTR